MADYQENFIQKMRFYRKRAGITQAQLAELCGVSNGTIGNIECGITKPSFDLIIKIAQSIKISPSELFTTNEKNFSNDDALLNFQYEIVRETVNSAVNKAVNEALKDLKFKIEH